MTIEDDIKAVEEEISKTKYNKATSHHIGKLKAKLAAMRDEQIRRASQGGGGGGGYAVKKSGHATLSLVGFPSVGKSTILNRLTNANSEVAAYEFTTLDVIPGLLEYRGAKIQVLDLPGLIKGASRGKGRGREVLAVVRSCDLIMLIMDALRPANVEVLIEELRDAGIRLNEKPPNIRIVHKKQGGIGLNATVKLAHLNEELVRDIMSEFGIINADVIVRQNASVEQLIDYVSGNRIYVPAFIAINKVDAITTGELSSMRKKWHGWHTVPVSASKGTGIDELKETIYAKLRFIRVFMKPPGREPDFKDALVLKSGSDVGTVCDMIHREWRRKFRYAIVTGTSAKFAEQTVGLDHELNDEDILTIVTKR